MDSNMKIESKAMTGTRNGVRSGADYIASLQDDRSVWIDGERIKDVTVDRRFRGAIQSIADLYDMRRLPARAWVCPSFSRAPPRTCAAGAT